MTMLASVRLLKPGRSVSWLRGRPRPELDDGTIVDPASAGWACPMSIQIYGFWRSIASFRVRVALRLKDLPFEEIPIDILSGEQFEPKYASVNAERVVPTFVHDGHSVFQSLAI